MRRILPWAASVYACFAFIGCAPGTDTEGERASDDAAFTQSTVDADPVLRSLQAAAGDVNQYEINVTDIAVPEPSASVGASMNGFSTRGLDWFKNPAVSYPDNKRWEQGTPTGKKCQWAAVFRFNAIFSDPPAEAIEMVNLPGGMWHGSFWSWTDDFASTETVGTPTRSYAWSSSLWKWIGASGKDGLCRLPTKTMIAKMMSACIEHARAHDGDPKGCRMPAYDPTVEPGAASLRPLGE